MDILFTLVASVLLIIGFFVICRTADDDEDDEEYTEEADRDTANGNGREQ